MNALWMVAAAQACPVCGAASTNDQGSYLAMTIVLSLLPLGAVGGIVWWVARHARSAVTSGGGSP